MFKTEDLVQSITTIRNQDIVIYGYDSEILGDINQTLNSLSECINKNGSIILECMFTNPGLDRIEGVPTETEMIERIDDCGFEIIDKIHWDRRRLREVNKFNNTLIEKNVNDLITLNPDKELLFRKYFENQINECKGIENDFTCTTMLLKKSTSAKQFEI